ncbi:hypothetical protein ACF07Y_33935 [Streptomyces sp. NPDC016566]|uniref:hypothetical protein n=1 Tax=Streptomyces sp. NPDC016566 TaxID=3364967 RepID=UPI0036FE2FE7
MSNTTPPPPEFTPPPPAAPPKKSRTNLIIIGSAAAVIAAVIGTGIVVVNSRHDSGKQDSKASTAPSTGRAATAAEDPTPEPAYDTVNENSFTIKLKTTKKQCFGSAGCNLTVEPRLTYMGDSEGIDPDAIYEITYEIHGDESGPVIETAELSDQTSLNYTPSMISTGSSGTKVTAEITDVSTSG